jgi:hypothetical protein
MARPTLYNAELLETIIDRLSAGEPMAAICREEGMPAARTVRDWINRHASVSAAIAGARDDGEEWLAAECLLIADTPRPGYIEEFERRMVDNPDDPDGEQVEEFVLAKRRVEDMLAHRKLQIETRLKLLAKWNPRKWGEKVEVNGRLTLEQLVAASTQQPAGEESKG